MSRRPRRFQRRPLMIFIGVLVAGAFIAGRAMNLGGSSGQTGIENYEDARPVFWRRIYPDGGRTLYCDESFGPGYNAGLNIEHVFPMS